MLEWFRRLDEIIRGDATQLSKLKDGQVQIPVGGISIAAAVLGVVYGICMGSFAVIRTGGTADAWLQMLASAVKLPLLFFLTLLVTLPSLYVFSALVGSRLTLVSVVRLLVAMLAVMMAVLASLGPIVVFFGISTTSYVFMKLLNVAMASIAGVLGLAFLLQTLHRLIRSHAPPSLPKPERPPEEDKAPTGALDPYGAGTNRRARAVFQIWVGVFALVGAQMSWVLRPFIGNPELPFTWFRARESNFFIDVAVSFGRLLGIE
jgi:hypothetical protein